MYGWSSLRLLILFAAAFGYFANGAQAHLSISSGETLNLQMCTTGSSHTITLDLPGDPVKETRETCCGDCLTMAAVMAPHGAILIEQVFYVQPLPIELPERVSPRSPLWPGAPPNGPPSDHKT